MPELALPPAAFAKIDTSSDLEFYALPRFVTHIDDAALAALTALYGQVLPAGGRLLDLMSSWVSHLPADVEYAEVVGHGMNAAELAANPRLTRRFVQNLNAEQRLPLTDGAVDAAMCVAGAQYLQRPVDVFAEVRRALVPGAPFVVSFSNRCFPTKAVAVWRALDGAGHARLVAAYLAAAGFVDVDVTVLADGRRGDPMTAVTGRVPEVP